MATSTLASEIRQHRTSEVTLRLQMDGRPLSGSVPTVRQTAHRLLFGSNWGDCAVALANSELDGEALLAAQRRNERFLNLLNFVTLPFYWSGFEQVRGQPRTSRLMNAARWYRERGCTVKGHPLVWHTLAPDWLLLLTNEEILSMLLARIQREVTDFASYIDAWDVVNESVIMPVFDRYDNGISRICRELGQVELIRRVFAAARALNTKALLVLNDFDVSPDYEAVIGRCLDAGIRIDAIGIQSHMHQGYWGLEKTQDVLTRFARFGLPLQFTEITLVSGELMPAHIVDLNDHQVKDWPSTPEGEARQATEVVEFYRTLVAHPAVRAITWWDLADGAWLNAPSGLLRRDYSPKPAYEELHRLIKGDWWLSDTPMPVDAQGTARFSGFLGDYEVSCLGKRATFSLERAGPATIEVELLGP